MSEEILDLGEVNAAGRSVVEALHLVRGYIRKHSDQKIEDGMYRVAVKTNNGTEDWTFDSTVGYPWVNGVETDWDAIWRDSVKMN